jgi:hypothetical protein
VVSSAGGKLHEPARSNLINYVKEVKRFGFSRLTVAMGPQWTNAPFPKELYEGRYDPAKFGENWRFLRSVRSVAKRYGPRDTRIDLLNEGAPSDYLAPDLLRQRKRYVGGFYKRYVKAFGNRDVTVSTIAPREPKDKADRLQNLINIIRSTGEPPPRWFDIHIGYDAPKASYGLQNSDAVLSRNGLRQPLVVGETAYGSSGVAGAIRQFSEQSRRPVNEVSPWHLFSERGCNVPPPYRPEPYRSKLERGLGG